MTTDFEENRTNEEFTPDPNKLYHLDFAKGIVTAPDGRTEILDIGGEEKPVRSSTMTNSEILEALGQVEQKPQLDFAGELSRLPKSGEIFRDAARQSVQAREETEERFLTGK